MKCKKVNTNAASHKTGMARLWELALRNKILVIASCALSVISVAVSFTPFIAIYYLIRELVINFADLSRLNSSYMIKLGWLAFGAAAGAIFINFIALMFSHLAAFNTIYRLKLEFLRHIGLLPLGFHTQNSTGKLRKIADENIEKLEGFIAHQLPDIAGSFAMAIITLIILFVFDWRLGLASFIPVLTAYLIQIKAFGNKQAQIFITKYQNSLEDMNNAAVEYVRGISVVKAFNQTIYSFRKFYETIKTYGVFCLNYTKEYEIYMGLFMLIINSVYLFLIPAVILLSGGVKDYSEFAFAAIFYFIFSVAIPTSFLKLLYVSQNGRMILSGIERMDKIFAAQPLIEPAAPKTVSNYNVSFENVSFTYGGDFKTPAIEDISFTANQGEITALVGPSGSGKSTIAHLIARFYEVSSGTIKIGGTDIRDMSSLYLMSIISFVFQDVFLFKQSVLDNILAGNKNASRNDAIASAKAAMCDEFVKELPQGYDTVIGADNVHLSGGQRQRIVIARTILKNAPIIVLDEATAFADPENEQNIHKAFESLMKDKTVIIIAHRLSTVRNADKIIVIDNGRMDEQGRHEQLVNSGRRYSRMWERYSNAINWKIKRESRV
ncbi:MAG: ABC transporter ATP-binding protein/permease [Elusimicrobiota bacterium]|jgi:ATP-binding cassette subfamily B protein|nr:ABC transporter ATP-binding protein/permease [Elusimicrobiota bacterium]